MSRRIYILLVLITLFSCNSNDNSKKTISIGFSQSIDNDIWRKSMDHTMEVEASLHPEVNLTIYNANRQPKKQISDIEKFIKDKVDVIIVSPFESDSIVAVIEKANVKGIPVIIVDRKVNTSNYSSYLGADNVEVGRIAGKHIVSLSKGRANVVEIKGESITSPGLERSLGFRQIINQYSGIKVISMNADNFESPKNNFLKLLDSLPTIDYVFAFNDIIAYKVWKIAKNKGLEKKNKIYRG
jgi:ABC-type sugar transport system substrate-binding protein